MRRQFVFPADVELDEQGFWLVTFPDVPEACTDGRTYDEALHEGEDALATALGGYVQDRRAIPRPSKPKRDQALVYLSPLVAAKLALYETMREQGVTKVKLAKRLGLTEGAVRKLVHPDHSSKIEKVDAAIRALGKQLIVEAA
jgi:antitoxin HicB